MEEAQQGVETASTETVSQQISPAQIAALAQVTPLKQQLHVCPSSSLVPHQ